MVSRVGLRSWVVAGLAGTMLVPGLAMGQQKAEMAKIAAEAQSAKHTAGPSMVRSVAGLKIDGQRKLVLESKPGEFLAQMKSANLPASTPDHKSFGDLPVSGLVNARAYRPVAFSSSPLSGVVPHSAAARNLKANRAVRPRKP